MSNINQTIEINFKKGMLRFTAYIFSDGGCSVRRTNQGDDMLRPGKYFASLKEAEDYYGMKIGG